jgi:hypothetical protein
VIEEKIPQMSTKKQHNDEELDDATPFAKLKFKEGIQLELRSFEITIQPWNGDKFTLNPEPTDYIDDVKEIMQELKNIPVDHQRLTFQGQLVDDSLTLEEQEIENHAMLVLEPMQIHVMLPDGNKLTFTVELDDTVKKSRDWFRKRRVFR